MPDEGKPVHLSGHATEQMAFRGGRREEVVEAIRTAHWESAEQGRLECHKEYPFNAEWNGVRYRTKKVRPIFVEKEEEIVVVTVYVYFF